MTNKSSDESRIAQVAAQPRRKPLVLMSDQAKTKWRDKKNIHVAALKTHVKAIKKRRRAVKP